MNVLFLGNSHTYYNDMPQLFKEICRERGKTVQVRMLAQPGVTYGWHLEHDIELRFELMYGKYDYLIMQQAAHSPCPRRDETWRDGHEIVSLARRFGVTPIQTMPWAERRNPAHQAEMYDIFNGFAKREKIRINPVGQIFEEVLRNHPDIDMYWVDGEHASPYGTYAIALCTYASVFGESVKDVGILHSYLTYPVSGEDWDRVAKAYRLASANPGRPELMKEAEKIRKRFCSALLDQAEACFSLDAGKAGVLRSLVDRIALPSGETDCPTAG